MERDSIANIACGDFTQIDTVKDVYQVIYDNIINLEDRLWNLPNQNEQDITTLGPFFARNLLETICTALVGRIDPFRLLFVREVQQRDGFNLGSRSNAAITWFGDIFEKGLSENELKPHKMWDPNKKFENVGRGLLGDYYGHIFWNTAYKILLDSTKDLDNDPIDYYRMSISSPDKFITYIRQRASHLYSSLSKGVHSEIVVEPEIRYDKPTVLQLISEVMELTAILSLVIHYVDSSICKLPLDTALDQYLKLKKWSDSYGI
ncbi:hypothetical protein [Rossellomorea vietnamensis]|uniref:hypothetical protein n=1 Tax=Rossellomorea vietnamensis TaxID=218284 RepID=UPI001E30B4DB|nr:hypothetical protein [Rossellomorea vietnamensis]MCC5803788.1 hypothetical protein [Rossellomorea vietnamensis]